VVKRSRAGIGIAQWVGVAFAALLGAPMNARAETGANAPQETAFTIGPVVGWDRNELKVRGPRGMTTTETDTAAEYGVVFLFSHPNVAVNDFLFFCRVNEADVLGNLLFVNGYGNREAEWTWNVGAGHLYHEIKPDNEDIRISVPLVKAGPLWNLPTLNLSLNPYLGYVWEQIDTRHGDENNDYVLYGLSVSWRWRMLAANANYYYQEGQDADKDYQTLHVRMHVFFNPQWSLVARVDYMEHSVTKDTSFLVGPAFRF